jgi:hypothetical protein
MPAAVLRSFFFVATPSTREGTLRESGGANARLSHGKLHYGVKSQIQASAPMNFRRHVRIVGRCRICFSLRRASAQLVVVLFCFRYARLLLPRLMSIWKN